MRPRVQAVHVPQQPHERVDIEQEVTRAHNSSAFSFAISAAVTRRPRGPTGTIAGSPDTGWFTIL